jgi:sulfur carrier protein
MDVTTSRRTAIVVNGEPRQTEARTVAELLAQLGYGEKEVATALNSEFVPRHARAHTRLERNDRVEIVSPRQGG